MEIHQLEYVLEVAKQRHFTRAADEINVVQSSLSQQIAKLEDELGVKLFERTTRCVNLTPAGVEFVQHAKRILADLEKAKESMLLYGGMLRGTLHIGVIASLESIDFVNIVTSFRTLYPGMVVNIIQQGSHKLIEMLRMNIVDIAFLTMPVHMEHQDIEFTHLGTDEFVLVTKKEHPFVKRKYIDLIEAENENFVFHHKDESIYHICLVACNNAGFQPKIVCQSSHSPTSLALINAGIGVGFFPWKN